MTDSNDKLELFYCSIIGMLHSMIAPEGQQSAQNHPVTWRHTETSGFMETQETNLPLLASAKKIDRDESYDSCCDIN